MTEIFFKSRCTMEEWLYYSDHGIFEYTWENNGPAFPNDPCAHRDVLEDALGAVPHVRC